MTQQKAGKPAAKAAPAKKAAPVPARPVGRPSGYKPEFALEAAIQCAEGATDQELADHFEIGIRTLYAWKNRYPEFQQALKAGKAPADERVERSLFERANGYERDEVDIRVVNNEIVQTRIRKWYPPDTTAAIFWLKNRKPAEWRDKTDVEHSGEMKITGIERTFI